MRRTTAVLIIAAAFALSIQACTNRNEKANQDYNNNGLDHDTMVTPMDTNNRMDTNSRHLDTMGMNRDTMGMSPRR